MIKAISFTTNYGFTKTASKKVFQNKSNYQQSPISFSGIMDNPGARRIEDANGNTYIIETGGNLVIHNGDKENKKGVKEALTGAGVGAAGTSVAAKNTNKGNDRTKTTDQDEIKPHESVKNDTDTTDDDIQKVSSSDDTIDEPDYDYDTDYDDDDDSIFDDSQPIYEF